MEQIRDEMRRLEAEIEYHIKKYHEEDAPEISDYEYDSLFERLKNLEMQYPEIASPASPTHRTGGQVAERFEKVTHEVFMGSMGDVFDFAALGEFDRKIKNEFPQADYVAECKIDGLSVALEYIDGVFIRGATRGNGYVGEDVTFNLRTIRSLPLKLKGDFPRRLIVRGEVYMPKRQFALLNEKRSEEGQSLFANPRNAAAGSLRQLNSALCAERGLEIFIFNLQLTDGIMPKTHSQSLKWLASLGFCVSPFSVVCKNIDEVISQINILDEKRHSLEFDIDGAVVKVDDYDMRNELGNAGSVPKWQTAYKYPPETVKTKIENITVQVGRTGVLTPKAVLTPVSVAGSIVSFATLHNIDYIKSRDIRIGDTVTVHKAGDIIPEIIGVDLNLRPEGLVEFEMPISCPGCGMTVSREEGEAAVRCINASCPAQLQRTLEHFVSRNAMNIENLGASTLARLIESGRVKHAADIYSLDAEFLAELERMGEKSAKTLVESINNSKSNPLSRLIYALGIRHVGEKTAKLLAEHFVKMDILTQADLDKIVSIHEIGMETGLAVKRFFENPENLAAVEQLAAAGVNMEEQTAEKGTAFAGMAVVITGTLVSMGRKEAEELVARQGGRTSSSVSKKTDLLVCGEAPGSKRDKALELGVRVIDEAEFLRTAGV